MNDMTEAVSRRYELDTTEGPLCLDLDRRTITLGESGGSLDGATAMVETAGEMNKRISLTRVALVGVFALAWRKKKDDRELYILIEGADYTMLCRLSPALGERARKFAAAISAVGKGGEPVTTGLIPWRSEDQRAKDDQLGKIIAGVVIAIIVIVLVYAYAR